MDVSGFYPRGAPPVAVAAECANTPEDAADDLFVVIESFDGKRQRFGPCFFAPKAGELPERGDDCLVVFDSDGIPWVPLWWNASPEVGGGGGEGPPGPTGPAGPTGPTGATGAAGSAEAGQRVSAEFTANSGLMTPGTENPVTVTHSIGVIPSVVVGHLEDGSWAHASQWRVSARTTSQLTVHFRNHHTTENVTAILRFRCLY